MNFERPSQESNQEEQVEKPKNPILKMRDTVREHSTELRNNVAEIQAARYELAVQLLMERSSENTELINALNDFTKALETVSYRGQSDKPMSPVHIKEITNFLKEKAKELSDDTLTGNRGIGSKR